MVGVYWRRIAVHAWSQSLQTLGFGSRARVVTAFLTLLITAAVLLYWGSQDAAGDMALERGVLWILAISVFPFVYVWHFVRAPAEIDQQNRQKIIRLVDVTSKVTAQLTKKEVDRIKILTLSVFRENGQVLMSKVISSDEYPLWSSDLEKWKSVGVTCLATDFSHPDAVAFRMVQYQSLPYREKVNDDHNQKLNALAARLQILKNVIDRYQDQWSPISPAERLITNSRLAVFEGQNPAPDGIKTLDQKDSGELPSG